VPFPERAEWILYRRRLRLRQYNAIAFDDIGEFVACLEAQGHSDGLWNGRLGLARQTARNHLRSSSKE